ncbi:hypothetical protein GCM10025777_22380 [Membranihabitans marinus]
MIFTLQSCQQKPNTSTLDLDPAERLDPNRGLPPYPQIEIPEQADMESPRWKGIDLTPVPPVIPKSVREEQADFVLRPGYEIHPVLTEPNIKEPAAIQFDGNGRMYVLELRSYMQDIDATDELQPISRISRWEDTDNDGVYDKGVVFLDSLVFPRFVVPFGPNTILTMESNEDIVYKCIDTDDDGKVDKKEVFASGLGRSGNVEHQTSFLTWTLDNWMYSTYNPLRIRWTPEGVIKEATGVPYGQWGVTQDNYGKIWFQGGASGVPENFQFPTIYGNYRVKGQFRDGFRVPYSLVKLEDFEPGMREVKPDGSLSNVTGAAGNDVYRGHRLPEDLVGEYIYGEPVGRIVRRVHTELEEGLTYIQNVYEKEEAEFIQSRDPLFRPTDIATAPDGTLYIVDMYRGIIQEGNWTQQGSYLRTKIQQYQMDDIIENGRIWRLSYRGMERDKTQPRMFEETTEELVQHLHHPNGWWRDKAQQLIILRQDKSVAETLKKMALEQDNLLGRIHALWTLEGLGSLDLSFIRKLFADADPMVRQQAIRASETLYKYGSVDLVEDYIKMAEDESVEVAIQALQTLYILDVKTAEKVISTKLKDESSKGIQLVGQQLLDNIAEKSKLAASQFSMSEKKLFDKGKEIYSSFCATCHGVQGLGTPTGNGDVIAPALSGSPRIVGHPEYIVKTLLHGLTGTIEGKTYEGIMVSMASNDDDWIASVTSYIRNDMGNKASFVSEDYVTELRSQTQDRTESYTFEELSSEVPQPLLMDKTWKVTASSTALQGVGSTRDPGYGFGYKGWKSDEAIKSGMWYQVEFPQPYLLSTISFESNDKNHPLAYAIEVSNDGQNWTEKASAKGHKGKNTVDIKNPIQAKFVRFLSSEDGEEQWAMKRILFYARGIN